MGSMRTFEERVETYMEIALVGNHGNIQAAYESTYLIADTEIRNAVRDELVLRGAQP